MCMPWWTAEGGERNSLKPFLLILHLAFGASLGIAFLTRSTVWRTKRVALSRRLFPSVLFSRDQKMLSLVKNNFSVAFKTWTKQC